MQKHKLLNLNKIIEERLGLKEVEIATNVKLNPLYIIDRKDEIESLRWTTRIIRWVLDRAIDGRRQLGATKIRLELADTKKFENMLYDKIRARDKEVLVNKIHTLRCVLGHLFNLKSGGDETRAIGIAEANNDYQQINRLRKQLIKVHDVESEICTQNT